jgi:long-chain acyl-CoA synthetase
VAIHPEEEAGRVGHILHSAGARVVFVEDEEQLDKVLTIRTHCPALARIVILEPKGLREFSDLQCSFLRDFVAGGAGRTGWAEAVAAVRPESQAAVLYPRGEPNAMGRMLTHGDILHMLAQAQRMLGLRPGDERLAVLPMNDVTERVLGLYLALATGTISNYLEGPETATENLQQLQPTVFAADAAVWDALHARTTRAAAAATPLQRTLYNWAIRIGQARSVLRPLADLLVLRAVRRELGLTKLRLAYVGGRPVSAEVDVWSRALGIVLQRVDRPETGAATADDRYRTLIQGAYAGA